MLLAQQMPTMQRKASQDSGKSGAKRKSRTVWMPKTRGRRLIPPWSASKPPVLLPAIKAKPSSKSKMFSQLFGKSAAVKIYSQK